jgi:hypothetical protein
MKLVMNRYQLAEKCKICTKIDAKERAIRKEEDRIRRWRKQHGRSASIAKAEQDIYNYECDIQKLAYDREVKRGNLNDGEYEVESLQRKELSKTNFTLKRFFSRNPEILKPDSWCWLPNEFS